MLKNETKTKKSLKIKIENDNNAAAENENDEAETEGFKKEVDAVDDTKARTNLIRGKDEDATAGEIKIKKDGMDTNEANINEHATKKDSKDTSSDNTSVKKRRGRKPKSEAVDAKDKVVAKTRERKRKTPESSVSDDATDDSQTGEDKKPKFKKPRNSGVNGQKRKRNIPSISLAELAASMPTPPPTPPPQPFSMAKEKVMDPEELARRELLRKIPWFREEIKEIFDYLCDRNVYWKNDLPKNKKYSMRDTKALEKEVKDRVKEIVETYRTEAEVMKEWESAEMERKAQEVKKESIVKEEGGQDETEAISLNT